MGPSAFCATNWPGCTLRMRVAAWAMCAVQLAFPGAYSAQIVSWLAILAGVDSHSTPTSTRSPDAIHGSRGAYELSSPPLLRRISIIQLRRRFSSLRLLVSKSAMALAYWGKKLGSVSSAVCEDSSRSDGDLSWAAAAGVGVVTGAAHGFDVALQKVTTGAGRAPVAVVASGLATLAPSLRRGTFVSAAYAVVDVEAGTLAVARAGHCPPVHARDAALPGGGARLLRGRGVALGLGSLDLFRRTLDEQHVDLAPGDAFVLYTDGLVEARDAAGEEWGYARLLDAVARHRAEPATALLAALLAEHRAWSAMPDAPADDVTVVVMKWNGRKEGLTVDV